MFYYILNIYYILKMNWLDILTTATKYIPAIYERCVIYWEDCTIGQIAFNDTIVSLKDI